jgi:uncharacterized protein
MIDRLDVRNRPEGAPLLLQTWGKLLFLHWRLPEELLRPLVPAGLELDLLEGEAWVSVTPFTMWGIRPPRLPAVPLLSESHELNVRTYVHRDGIPGVWFLSLDASNPMAVVGARVGFHLPYYAARMSLEEEGREVRFSSRRVHPGAPDAEFEARWERGPLVGEAEPGTREFFLVERYCLYAERGGELLRARIHHRPWPLEAVRLASLGSTMLRSHGLPEPAEAPLLQGQAEPLEVEVWPLEAVG